MPCHVEARTLPPPASTPVAAWASSTSPRDAPHAPPRPGPRRPSGARAAHCTRRVAEALAARASRSTSVTPSLHGVRASLDVYVLDHDGAIVDAAIAAVAALDASSRTSPWTSEASGAYAGAARDLTPSEAAGAGVEEGGEEATASRSSARALKLGAVTPLALTIGQYRDALVVDPTASEEALMESVACVIVGEDGGVSGIADVVTVPRRGAIGGSAASGGREAEVDRSRPARTVDEAFPGECPSRCARADGEVKGPTALTRSSRRPAVISHVLFSDTAFGLGLVGSLVRELPASPPRHRRSPHPPSPRPLLPTSPPARP